MNHAEGSLEWLVSNLVKVCIFISFGLASVLIKFFYLELGKGNVLQTQCR